MAATDLRIALVGRLGTPQLACLRSWRRHGVPVLFLHADAAPLPRLVGWLLGVRCVHLGPLQPGDPAFVARLSALLVAEQVQALTCVSESTSVALWSMADRLPLGLRILSAHPRQIAVLESKVQQDHAARQAGLPTLPSWHLVPGARAEVPGDHFPLVLRPDVQATVQPRFKVAVVQDAATLQAFVDRLAPQSSGVVAQPLVRGPNLLVHAYRAAGGRWHGHVGFRAEVKHQGFTVVLRPEPLAPALREACTRLEASLGLTGVYHYDFVQCEQTGQPYFLDLNPRLGGSTGKVLAAGYDEPLALLGTQQTGGLPRADIVAEPLAVSGGKHQAVRAMLSAMRGSSTAADYPYPARRQLWHALLSYVFTGRDELFRRGGWRSLAAFVLYQLNKRL